MKGKASIPPASPDWPIQWKNLTSGPTLAALAFTVGLPLVVALMPKDITRAWSLELPFWIFLAQTILAVAIAIRHRASLVQFLQRIWPGRGWAIALVVFALLGSAMAITWISPHHRVQSDESIFLTTAQNLFAEQVAGSCDEGYFDQGKLDCISSASNFKAKGLSWLVMLAMPFLGQDLHWVFGFHMVLYLLTWFVSFAAVLAWTRSPLLSLAATVFLLVQPTTLFQFRSFSVEPLYVLLSALAMLSFRWAREDDKPESWAMLGIILAFFAQTRQETVFCLPAFALFAVPGLLARKDFRAASFLVPLVTFSLPILFTISSFQGYGFQGGETQAHGNFLVNLKIFWNTMADTPMKDGLLWNPFLSWFAWGAAFGLLDLCATSFSSKERRRWLGFLLLYHLQSYMILENVSGDLTIEINQRYTLVMFPTMAFLAALFVRDLWNMGLPFFLGIKPEKFSAFIPQFVAAVAVSALATGLTARHEASFKADIMYNRNHLTNEEIGIHNWLAGETKGKLFVYSRPWHFIAYGWSAIHYDRFLRMSPEERRNLLERFHGEVYYVRGLDCWDRQTWHRKAVESRITSVCDHFESAIETNNVLSFTVTNNYWVKVERILGDRGYDQATLLVGGLFQIFADKGYSLLSYSMGQSKVSMGAMKILCNDSLISEQPFTTSEHLDTLRELPLQPGLNTMRLEAFSADGKHLVSRELHAFATIGGAQPLSALQPVSATQSWGELRRNATVDGKGLLVQGIAYDQGLGTHAFSRVEYLLDKPMKRFRAIAGLDDEQMGGDGARFRVLGDAGKVLYDSGPIRPGIRVSVDADISGIRTLVLEVDSLANKDYDHADWIYPTLIP